MTRRTKKWKAWTGWAKKTIQIIKRDWEIEQKGASERHKLALHEPALGRHHEYPHSYMTTNTQVLIWHHEYTRPNMTSHSNVKDTTCQRRIKAAHPISFCISPCHSSRDEFVPGLIPYFLHMTSYTEAGHGPAQTPSSLEIRSPLSFTFEFLLACNRLHPHISRYLFGKI